MEKKKFYLILVLLLSIGNAELLAQGKKMTRKEKEAAWRAERLKKRALEEREENRNDSIMFAQAVEAIRMGSWALEASNVTFDNGVTRFVTQSTNFVSVNNGEGIVQTAFNNTNINSPNGLGGITLEGRVVGEEIKRDEEGNFYMNYAIQGAEFSATVNVVVTANSNQATATVSPNYSSRQMTLSGYIYPYNSSGIIEGNPGYYWLNGSISSSWRWYYPTMYRPPVPPPPMWRPRPPRPQMRPPAFGAPGNSNRPPGFGGGGGSNRPPGFGGSGGSNRPPGFTY